MSDSRVHKALRSDAPLVLVEAAAGSGKTYQGAEYARDLLPTLFPGRLLVLTHTNAACDVFIDRTKATRSQVEIRTIDSLIVRIASAYHKALGLPSDVAAWAYRQGTTGFNQLAEKVANLLVQAPAISASLAARYPYVVCDEHQDSSEAQHQIILCIHHAGALTRVFGDPMQAIYRRRQDRDAWDRRWDQLRAAAHELAELDTPHRWKDHAAELGDWIGQARSALKAGREVDLRGQLPRGLTVIRADNTAVRHGQYRVRGEERRTIDRLVRAAPELLVLASTNDTVRGLRAFFNRSIPIWEGQTRDALSALAVSCQKHQGDANAVAEVFIGFIQSVSVGFSDSAYGNILRSEVANGCSSPRAQKPAKIQELAKFIVECPDHQGVARALIRFGEFISGDHSFSDVKLDLKREFREATRLAQHEDASVAITELNLRRTIFRQPMPRKVISTVHKAKGLESENVLLMACDQKHFGGSDEKRRLLYVALSRATGSLTLVLPKQVPSPLFRVSSL